MNGFRPGTFMETAETVEKENQKRAGPEARYGKVGRGGVGWGDSKEGIDTG